MKARHNPFSSTCIHRLAYRSDSMPVAHIMAQLESLHYRGAIVGPEGSGKTTLLSEIDRCLEQSGFRVCRLRLDNRTRRFPRQFLKRLRKGLSSHHAVLLDGAEQLTWPCWRYFCYCIRKAGAFIITAHTPGRLPELVRTRTTPDLLFDLVSDLLGNGCSISRNDLDTIFHANSGNIRLALRHLYDRFADS